jgi:hypothetical protein
MKRLDAVASDGEEVGHVEGTGTYAGRGACEWREEAGEDVGQ